MLELSEAIRDYHDHTGLPQMVCYSWYLNKYNILYIGLAYSTVINAVDCILNYFRASVM
jgi:hypothetical protein